MPFISLKNAKLYYEDEGSGDETLVFGHSMLFNLRMFDDQVNFLRRDYRCVRFDFRGQGKSEITEEGYDLDSLTEETFELLQALDCTPCHFVGFSMGGMIALRLAIKYPGVVESLILIDTSSEPEPSNNILRNKSMLWVAKNVGLPILANRIMAMFFGPAFRKDPDRKPLQKMWRNHFLANDRLGIIKVINGVLARKGITDLLHQITMPTIILVGENDALTDLNKANIMQKEIKHSRLRVIPRAAHMTPVEEPDEVNSAIKTFLLSLSHG